ncbi:MAG: diacylglycerol/lipid kinase family protein [Verrucomicrobiales bacterium]
MHGQKWSNASPLLKAEASGSTAIILNPAAQSTRASRKVEVVRALATGAHVVETRAIGDARRLARELAEQGWSTVVAAGGDGTVNEVAAGLLEAAVPEPPVLGVLPLGTMNVFALELDLPVLNLRQCWERVVAGQARPIDAWKANDRTFFQMAGVGVDAQVIRQTSWEAKKSWGPLSYLGTLARVLDRPSAEVRVQVDDGPWITGGTVLLGNGRFYGGPFPVFPGAKNDDGLLDVAVIHGHGPAIFSNLVADVLFYEIDEEHEGVTRLRGSRVRLESPEMAPFEIDGESGGDTPLSVTRLPVPLRVLA